MQTDLLLIDDSFTSLHLLTDMAALRQLNVSFALDGETGYQQALLRRPGLILLDVRMPGMDGFATCRRLKANPQTRDIPVIFLTAANDLEERLQGFAVGAVVYLQALPRSRGSRPRRRASGIGAQARGVRPRGRADARQPRVRASRAPRKPC